MKWETKFHEDPNLPGVKLNTWEIPTLKSKEFQSFSKSSSFIRNKLVSCRSRINRLIGFPFVTVCIWSVNYEQDGHGNQSLITLSQQCELFLSSRLFTCSVLPQKRYENDLIFVPTFNSFYPLTIFSTMATIFIFFSRY